jgi:predicted secreted Zn-dependent protease
MNSLTIITDRYGGAEGYGRCASSIKRLISLLGILIFTVCSGTARAEPILIEKTVYYDIKGLSVSELQLQRQKLGPKAFFGNTETHTNYHYKNGANSLACYVTSVAVTVRITYTMPRWANKFQATAALRDKWDKFYQRLQFHEMGHKEISVRNARLLELRILEAGSQSCQSLDARLKEVWEDFLERTRRENAEYDRKTDHGRSQGAFLQ